MSTDSSKPAEVTIPWNPWWAVLYGLVIFFVAQILAGIVLATYPSLIGWSQTRANDWLNNSIGAQFTYVLLAETLTISLIYNFLQHYKCNFRTIGLRRPQLSDLGYALLAVVPYYMLYLLTVGLVTAIAPDFNVDQKQQLGFDNASQAGIVGMVLVFLSLVILPPLAEEIMVRGFIYTSLKKALRLGPAVVLTSALFAVAHLSGGVDGPLYVAALDTFVLSLVLIYLREKTGGLWAPIFLHAIKNGIAFLILFVFTSQ